MLSWSSTIGLVQTEALRAKHTAPRSRTQLSRQSAPSQQIQLVKLLGLSRKKRSQPQGAPLVNRIVYLLYKPPPPEVPKSDQKWIVHFHGLGQQLSEMIPLIERMNPEFKMGIVAVEYPGFGMAREYSPSEPIVYEDAVRAIAFLQNNLKISNDNIILQGYSFGTGIASEMAYRGLGSKLILIAPYLSVPEMASSLIPLLPTSIAKWLIQDQIDTKQKAPCVRVQVLIIHGTHDEVVPFWMGKRLAKLFPCVELVTLKCADHYVLKPKHLAQTLRLIKNFIMNPPTDEQQKECDRKRKINVSCK